MCESTQDPKSKGNIRPCNCEKDQFLNQPSIHFWIVKNVTAINHKFTLAFIGVLAGLHPKSHVSSRRSRTYFRWERSTLCFYVEP